MLRQELTIPPKTGKAFIVRAGRYLRVMTPDGPQAADLDVFNLENPRETFSSSRTRCDHSVHLTTGHTLISTPPGERVMMSITADTVQHRPSPRGTLSHDLLFGRCSRMGQLQRHGLAVVSGCQENLAEAIAEFGLTPDYVHDPFNIFMKRMRRQAITLSCARRLIAWLPSRHVRAARAARFRTGWGSRSSSLTARERRGEIHGA